MKTEYPAGAIVMCGLALAFQAQEPIRTIRGHVVDALSGRRLRSASVFLAVDRNEPQRSRSITDEAGAFSITAPPGRFDLWAARTGYGDGGYGQRTAEGPWAALTVRSSARVPDVTIRLWPHGVIRGRVLDERGEPVVASDVLALQQTWEFDQPGWVASRVHAGRTDDRGEYRLTGVPPGDYLLAVPSPDTFYSSSLDVGEASSAYPTTFFPGVESVVGATRLSIDAGQDLLAGDFIVSPAAVSRSVRGRVIGALPRARSEVELLPMDAPSWTDLDARRTTVSADGVFGFAHVPYGRYLVRAMSMAGWSNVFVNGQATTWIPVPPDYNRQTEASTTRAVWAEEPIEVGERELQPLVLDMHPGLHIGGRLLFDGSSARPPVASILETPMFVVPTDGRTLRTMPTTNFDRLGGFLTPELPSGTYALDVRTGNFQGWRVESIAVDGTPMPDARIDLGNGDISNVSVRLVDRLSGLEGTVRTPRGEPAAGRTVVILPAERRLWTGFGIPPQRVFSTLSDPEGHYRFVSLLPGDYLVTTSAGVLPTGWRQPDTLTQLAADATRVHLPNTGATRLDLRTAR